MALSCSTSTVNPSGAIMCVRVVGTNFFTFLLCLMSFFDKFSESITKELRVLGKSKRVLFFVFVSYVST